VRGMTKWVLLPAIVLAAGVGAGGVLAGDRDKYCDKCHPPTVTLTETAPGETVTVPGPERVRTVTETQTVTAPAETVIQTQTVTEPAVTETVVKTRTVTKVKWRTKIKTRWRTRTVIRKVCPKPKPTVRPCCEGAG
jgi:hypothetical protein